MKTLFVTNKQLYIYTSQYYSILWGRFCALGWQHYESFISFLLRIIVLVQLLSTKIVHFYDKSMKLCQITTNPKTNISGYGAKPNSTLDTSTAQALKWPT